jgi:DNA-directed RNA polymerase subunit H (RpoH/RPB5)
MRLFYGARRTCLEMLKDRGYVVPEQSFWLEEKNFEINESISGITDLDGKNVVIYMYDGSEKQTEIEDNVCKLIKLDKNLSLRDAKNAHIIIIYDANKVNNTKFETEYIGHPFIEVFDVHHLFINPTKHVYQAKWRLMSESEITEILQRYEAKMAQTSRVMLGSVCIDDPINRYYGGRPPSKERRGDVYEIIRDGVNIFYRKVIAKRMNLKN